MDYNEDVWKSDEMNFPQLNGPSYEFSQNYSQNSMMVSRGQDHEDSREYRKDSSRFNLKLL